MDSWLTTNSGRYARIYTSAAAKAAGNSTTTWSNGSQNQTLPAYCGPQEILSSGNWVYIRTTGLQSRDGPVVGRFPKSPRQHSYLLSHSSILPLVPTAKTLLYGFVPSVTLSMELRCLIHVMVFFWNGTTEAGGGGAGYWNRDVDVK